MHSRALALSAMRKQDERSAGCLRERLPVGIHVSGSPPGCTLQVRQARPGGSLLTSIRGFWESGYRRGGGRRQHPGGARWPGGRMGGSALSAARLWTRAGAEQTGTAAADNTQLCRSSSISSQESPHTHSLMALTDRACAGEPRNFHTTLAFGPTRRTPSIRISLIAGRLRRAIVAGANTNNTPHPVLAIAYLPASLPSVTSFTAVRDG